jgi:hypothetical protein
MLWIAYFLEPILEMHSSYCKNKIVGVNVGRIPIILPTNKK